MAGRLSYAEAAPLQRAAVRLAKAVEAAEAARHSPVAVRRITRGMTAVLKASVPILRKLDGRPAGEPWA